MAGKIYLALAILFAAAVGAKDVGPCALKLTKAFVKECTSRDSGTPGAEKAAKKIASLLPGAVVDSFDDETSWGKVRFHNVLFEIPAQRGADKSGTVVLMSHFDTKSGIGPKFQGANDGASSSMLLVEMAKRLKDKPLKNLNALFVFTDGEECKFDYGPKDGLHGSRHLAAKFKAQQKDIRAVILLDMVGDANLKLQLPRNSTPKLRLLALKSASALEVRKFIAPADFVILDDHQPFLDAGFPAVNLIDFEYGSEEGEETHWHTERDTCDKLSAQSLGITAAIAGEMLRRLDEEAKDGGKGKGR